MTNEDKNEKVEILDDICEECKKADETVKENLIMTGYKICNTEVLFLIYL